MLDLVRCFLTICFNYHMVLVLHFIDVIWLIWECYITLASRVLNATTSWCYFETELVVHEWVCNSSEIPQIFSCLIGPLNIYNTACKSPWISTFVLCETLFRDELQCKFYIFQYNTSHNSITWAFKNIRLMLCNEALHYSFLKKKKKGWLRPRN